MTLQKIINAVSKYPWRYGYGSWANCPLTKFCDIHQGSYDKAGDAALMLSISTEHINAFVGWWDSVLEREDFEVARFKDKLVRQGYTIPAGPRLIRARRKTKRVRAYQYLRSL